MLEKDKNCIEFSMRSMMVTHKPYQEDTEIDITGLAPGKSLLLANNPFDIPCDVVVVSKRYFERLQTENEELKKKLGEFDFMGWMESAKLWKKRYDDIFKLIGFSSVEEIQDYLTNEAKCDTLQEAVSKLKDQVKYTCDEWHSANSSNNSWKAAAECNSPKELIEKREALEKEIGVYSRALKEWKEGTGCPSPSAAKTLIESDMSRYHAYNEIKKANEKLADSIHQWQKVTGYDNPKDFLKWKANIEGIMEVWKSETGCKYPGDARRLLEKWQTMTRSETPENAAKWLERFEETDKRCDKLAREVESWKNAIGYSTPEDYLQARINFATPFDYTAAWQKVTGCDTPDQVKSRIEGLENAVRLTNRNMIKEIESNIDEWQKATGCDTPDKAKERIKALNERIDESEADYNHLLCTTGFESEGEIEDALDKCDHSTLLKALVDYEFGYKALLKLTGYKTEQDILVLLNDSEQFVYKDMRELINSLKRKAKFTDSNWQKATGCNTPGRAEEKLEFYKKRLGNAVQAASCAAKHLENIMF